MKAKPTCHTSATPSGHGHHHLVPVDSALPAPDAPVYMGLPDERFLRPRFYVALALTLPVLVLSMGPMVWDDFFTHITMRDSAWLQLALTTPVFFWSSAPFIRRWWKSLVTRDTNMFTLTVTGTGAAYFFSLAAVVFWAHLPGHYFSHHGGPIYFEAAAFITTIVLLGQILEQHTHSRTDAAIRALMQLDGRDEGRGFEIDRSAVMRKIMAGQVRPENHGCKAEKIRRPGAGDREREHVRIARDEGFPPPADERCAAPEKHRRGQR
jgi:Cation transport ATPase